MVVLCEVGGSACSKPVFLGVGVFGTCWEWRYRLLDVCRF